MNDSAKSYRSVAALCPASMAYDEAGATRVVPEPTTQVELSRLWRSLIDGASSVVDQFFRNDCCCLVLSDVVPAGSPLDGRRLEVIEAVLCGEVQSCIAIDLQLAPSTVATSAKQALECLGVSLRPSRVHPLLMLMATAARRGLTSTASVSFADSERGQLRVVEIPRPGQRVSAAWPSAERQVVELLVEGRCYTEIARLRRTSVRTVANQIAAVFRRLKVSGRSELIHHLFVADGLIPPLSGKDSPRHLHPSRKTG